MKTRHSVVPAARLMNPTPLEVEAGNGLAHDLPPVNESRGASDLPMSIAMSDDGSECCASLPE
jgi:hypothetical protein